MSNQPQETYLDQLVLEVINLQILNQLPESQRADAFLEQLGYAQKYVYIQDALNTKFAPVPLPNGFLNVATSHEVFVYRLIGGRLDDIHYLGFEQGQYSLKEFAREIKTRFKTKRNKPMELNFVFYDEGAKKPLDVAMNEQGFKTPQQVESKQIGGGGKIRYYRYMA